MILLAVIIAVIAVIALFIMVIGVFNSLVALKNAVKNAWAQIDTQLKRRYDLIPNLIECVKGYMEHEKSTYEMVVMLLFALHPLYIHKGLILLLLATKDLLHRVCRHAILPRAYHVTVFHVFKLVIELFLFQRIVYGV